MISYKALLEYMKHRREVVKRIYRIKEPLWARKFDPITEQPEPEPRHRVTYRLVPLFSDTTWLRQLHFNQYLRALQFKMTPEGVKRYCDGKEVEQKFFER